MEGLNLSGSEGSLLSREEGLWMSAPPAERALYDELRRVGHLQVCSHAIGNRRAGPHARGNVGAIPVELGRSRFAGWLNWGF